MRRLIRLLHLLFFCAPLVAAEEQRISVGAASVDITPDYPVRLSGYGGRRKPSDGIEQHLFAKALAIGSAEHGDLALILTVDNLGVPAPVTEKVFAEINAKVKLPREQFAICASHAH